MIAVGVGKKGTDVDEVVADDDVPGGSDVVGGVEVVGEGDVVGGDELLVVGWLSQGTICTVFVSRVTAPLRAKARPFIVAELSRVMDANERMVPSRWEPVPSVAELPTCQKTWHAWAPRVRTTLLAEAVMSVEPDWKMKTLSGSSRPLRVNVPVMAKESGALSST
jgi:hypothetical protein